MKERIKKLTDVLDEILSDSYGEQYGIADFLEGRDDLQKEMDKLSEESAFYQRTLDELEKLKLKID